MWSYAWPEDHESAVIVREYDGDQMEARFQADAEQLLEQGFEPVGQHYIEGGYGCGMIVLILITIPIGVGILLAANLLLSERPPGRLIVTYLQREGSASAEAAPRPRGSRRAR